MLFTVRIILNSEKLVCNIFLLHISAFQRIVPIFSVSFRMFRHFEYQTNKCMLHVIVRKYILFMQNHLQTSFISVIYILGVYHIHILYIIGHAALMKIMHKISYFLLPAWQIQREIHFCQCQANAYSTELLDSACSL